MMAVPALVLFAALSTSTPVPLPTPHVECIQVPVPSAGPCFCCARIMWRQYLPGEPERFEGPLECDCEGTR